MGRLIGLVTFQIRDAQTLNFVIPSDWIGELPKRNQFRTINMRQHIDAQWISARRLDVYGLLEYFPTE